MLFGAQDPAGDELENIAVRADDDGVACVVPAGPPRNLIERAREVVDDFTFAFIPPLRANDDDRFHSRFSWPGIAGVLQDWLLCRKYWGQKHTEENPGFMRNRNRTTGEG